MTKMWDSSSISTPSPSFELSLTSSLELVLSDVNLTGFSSLHINTEESKDFVARQRFRPFIVESQRKAEKVRDSLVFQKSNF